MWYSPITPYRVRVTAVGRAFYLKILDSELTAEPRLDSRGCTLHWTETK